MTRQPNRPITELEVLIRKFIKEHGYNVEIIPGTQDDPEFSVLMDGSHSKDDGHLPPQWICGYKIEDGIIEIWYNNWTVRRDVKKWGKPREKTSIPLADPNSIDKLIEEIIRITIVRMPDGFTKNNTKQLKFTIQNGNPEACAKAMYDLIKNNMRLKKGKYE